MFFFPWMWCLIKYFSMCAIMCEPHKFPRIHRVQLAKRISSISPQSHNKIPPASRNNYYTIPYIHPTQFFLQKKSSKILHSIRQGWWRWDTHGAHTIVIHLPRGKRPPNDPPLLLSTKTEDEQRPLLEGWQLLPGAMREIQEASDFLLFMIQFVYRHHINLLRRRRNHDNNNDKKKR